MSDDIIDLGAYLRNRSGEESRSTFAVWGGEGERSRFALPLWRAAYLAGGARAGLVWTPDDEDHGAVEALTVLDLAAEPARTTFDPELIRGLPAGDDDAPPVFASRGSRGLAVFLGRHGGRRWYLLVVELDDPGDRISARARDDILFLAGECAGLLVHRELAEADDEG